MTSIAVPVQACLSLPAPASALRASLADLAVEMDGVLVLRPLLLRVKVEPRMLVGTEPSRVWVASRPVHGELSWISVVHGWRPVWNADGGGGEGLGFGLEKGGFSLRLGGDEAG